MSNESYSANITLYNIEDGIGIDTIWIYYQWSKNRSIPPIDINEVGNEVGLTIDENGHLMTIHDYSSLTLDDKGHLSILYNEETHPFIMDENNYITSLEGWSATIPPEPTEPGPWYLWTRTIYRLENGTVNESLSVSGEQGPVGEPGKDGQPYNIVTNFSEIIIFYDPEQKKYIYSPENLTVQVEHFGTKEDFVLQETTNPSSDKILQIEYIDLSKGKQDWKDFPSDFIEKQENKKATINLTNLESQGEFAIQFQLSQLGQKSDEGALAYHIVSARMGTSKDMAKLAVKAEGIAAAVNGTHLEFNANGLVLKREKTTESGDKKTEQVFWADESGNLKITGTIYAENGKFNGTLGATTGKIGGFILKDSYMYTNAQGITDDSTLQAIKAISPLVIDGGNGEIIANNIALGAGATIQDFIKLGNAKIQNPVNPKDATETNRPFIQAGLNNEEIYLKMYSNGEIKLGENNGQIILNPNSEDNSPTIELSGLNTSIYGNRFKITPEVAEFQNINCSGKISTVVFENNHIQSVGGSMIFKTSIKIEDLARIKVEEKEYLEITLEEIPTEIEKGTILWFIGKDGEKSYEYIWQESDILESEKIKIPYPGQGTPWQSLIIIGQLNDLILGINSGSVSIGGIIEGKGITMQTKQRSVEGKPPLLFMGDLSKLQKNGYGLYCDNVYLRGQIVAQEGNISSGINTNSETTFTKANDNLIIKDTSNIIFWGGANDEQGGIANANFQVTEKGTLYAKNSLFEDAIFTNGEIYGAELHTAKIYGTENDPSLIIYDSNKGISFRSKEEEEIFNISPKGLALCNEAIIGISNGVVTFQGEQLKTNRIENLGSSLNFSKTYQEFSDKEILFNINEKTNFQIDQNGVSLLGNLKIFAQELKGLEYRAVDGGYDLYVFD